MMNQRPSARTMSSKFLNLTSNQQQDDWKLNSLRKHTNWNNSNNPAKRSGQMSSQKYIRSFCNSQLMHISSVLYIIGPTNWCKKKEKKVAFYINVSFAYLPSKNISILTQLHFSVDN